MSKKKAVFCIISWIFVAFSMFIIVYFALQDGEKSTQTSTGVVDAIIEALPNSDSITVEQKVEINISIRQLAHFSIYLLLGFALANALKCTVNRVGKIYIMLALAFSLEFSLFDEFVMQQNTTGRGAELKDVLTDTAGAILGIVCFSILFYVIRLIKNVKGNP